MEHPLYPRHTSTTRDGYIIRADGTIGDLRAITDASPILYDWARDEPELYDWANEDDTAETNETFTPQPRVLGSVSTRTVVNYLQEGPILRTTSSTS